MDQIKLKRLTFTRDITQYEVMDKFDKFYGLLIFDLPMGQWYFSPDPRVKDEVVLTSHLLYEIKEVIDHLNSHQEEFLRKLEECDDGQKSN